MGTTRAKTAAPWVDARLFQLLADKSPYGVVVFENGKVAYVNQSLAKLMDYPKREVEKLTVEDFLRWVHEEDRPVASEQYAQLLAGKPPSKRHEFRFVDRKGAVRWVDSVGTLFEKDGKTILQATVMDITDRKRTEEALRASVEGQRSLYQNAEAGLFRTRISDGKLLECNQKQAQILGYESREACIAEHVSSRHYADPHARAQMLARLKKTGEVTNFEVQAVRKDGSPFWVSLSVHAYPKEGYLEGVMVDITERKRVEAALLESEAKYRTLVEQALDGIVIGQAPPLHLVFANPAMGRILGYAPDELTSLAPKELEGLVHPEDRAVFFGRFKDRLEGKPAPPRYDVRGMRRDGEVRWLEASFPRIEFNGQLAVQAAFQDITERKVAETALRESEEKYRELYETIREGIVATDLQGRILECNQAYADMLGYSKDEVLKLSYQQLTPERWHQSEARIVKGQILKRGYSDPYEKEYIRKDGTVFPITVQVFLVKDKAGKPKGMWGTVNDIAERKQAEDKLRASEERYRLLYENLADGLFIFDREGKIKMCNATGAEMFGYAPSELLAAHFKMLVHPDDREMVSRQFEDGLRTQSTPPGGLEAKGVRKDGSIFFFHVASKLLRQDGQPQGIQSLVRDVTERKLQEKKTQEARNRAEFFIDLMSHDLNNINQGILSTLELALQGPDLPAASHEQMQLATDQVMRSADLIRRVKKIARLDLEAPPLTVRDVSQALLDAVEAAKSSLPAKTLKLTTNIREGAYHVLADELLNDVFFNLLHNAMKFDESNRVAVEVKATRDREKKFLKIEFKDWGPGIPDDAKERILNRLTSRQEQRTRTSGIGLTLVRGIVDRYGGQIWVEDRVPGDFNRGANFVVLLPMAK